MWSTPPILPNISLSNSQPNFAYTQFDINNINVSVSGAQYGTQPLLALGNVMDYILVKQALEEKNKIVWGEHYYNISGDIVEIPPVPGGRTPVPKDAKLIYYYFDKDDMLGINQQEPDVDALINNPAVVKFDQIPWVKLSQHSRTWIGEYTIAEAKYIQGSKLRIVSKVAAPGEDYAVEFDYQSFIDDVKEMKEQLKTELKDSLAKMNTRQIMEDKAAIIDATNKINKTYPKKIYLK